MATKGLGSLPLVLSRFANMQVAGFVAHMDQRKAQQMSIGHASGADHGFCW